jgi:UDP-hydrolysing UDP-N-acetyl-D-glucosamine 2-epimerase
VRTIAFATTSRADYSTSRPVLRELSGRVGIETRILASGTHLRPEWGSTVDEIEADALAAVERLQVPVGTTAEKAAASVGGTATVFGQSFARSRPDVLVIVGDRLELLGVAAAALPFQIPIAHISGGDATGGAIDDLVRHALSKLAHLHFVAMEEHADRLRRMGEAPERITVSGDPALDEARGPWPSLGELAADLGVELERPLALVGFHPTTIGSVSPAEEVAALLGALESFPGTIVITFPGADVGADQITAAYDAFAAGHARVVLRPSLGQGRYYGLLSQADILVGNTSSGIWEAPSFELPVVNVGDRQHGRVRARNVIDVPARRDAIAAGIEEALDPAFRASLAGLANPYGDGKAAERIVSVLASVRLDDSLLAKWRT